MTPPARTRAAALPTALAVGALVLAGCRSGGSTPGGVASAVSTARTGPGGVQVVDVTGTPQITFDPATVVAHPGMIEVHFTVPADSALHSFHLAQLGVDTGIFGGTTRVVRFTVSRPGRYRYTCDIHPGMQGQLVVGPP